MAKIAHFAYKDMKHDITVVVHDREDGSGMADGHTIEVIADRVLPSGAQDRESITMLRPAGVQVEDVLEEAESRFDGILFRLTGIRRDT